MVPSLWILPDFQHLHFGKGTGYVSDNGRFPAYAVLKKDHGGHGEDTELHGENYYFLAEKCDEQIKMCIYEFLSSLH